MCDRPYSLLQPSFMDYESRFDGAFGFGYVFVLAVKQVYLELCNIVRTMELDARDWETCEVPREIRDSIRKSS